MPLEVCFSSCPISALSTKPPPNADYFPHQQEVFHSFMKTIFSTVKLKKAALAGLLVLVLASSLCQMLLPAFLSQMISRGVAAGADSVILIYGTVIAGITVLSCIISFLSVKTASSVSTDFAAQLRTKVFSSVLEFSAAEMDHFGTASLITRSTSDIANV